MIPLRDLDVTTQLVYVSLKTAKCCFFFRMFLLQNHPVKKRCKQLQLRFKALAETMMVVFLSHPYKNTMQTHLFPHTIIPPTYKYVRVRLLRVVYFF